MQNETEIIREALLRNSLFQSCPDGVLEKLAAGAKVIEAGKGQLLFSNEDDATNYYIVIKGWVKLYRETLDGAQAVVDILTTNHLFGETSIFQDDKYPYSAEATEPTTLISLPLKALKDAIENEPKIAMSMLSSMALYRKQQDNELEHRTLQNAPQRIGCFLLRLADQNSPGPVTIYLPYDKTLVASRLGMQPETFSRALAKLKKETGLRVKGATIEVDNILTLSRYACAACSSEFPCHDLKKSPLKVAE